MKELFKSTINTLTLGEMIEWIKNKWKAIKTIAKYSKRNMLRDKIDLGIWLFSIFVLIVTIVGVPNTGYSSVIFVVYVLGAMTRFGSWGDVMEKYIKNKSIRKLWGLDSWKEKTDKIKNG